MNFVVNKTQKLRKHKQVETALPVLQVVKKNCVQVLDYRTYWLPNKLPKCEEKSSSYIAKVVKNFKFQMMTHYFFSKDPVSIHGFFGYIQACLFTIRIQKDAVMRVLRRYVNETLGNDFNSRICSEDKSSPITASVCNINAGSRKHF